MAYLRHLVNGQTAGIFELGDRTSIGRHMSCNIVIDDPTISAEHAFIERHDVLYELTDLDSTNGVRVAGSPVNKVTLEDGVFFTLGTCDFQFHESLPTDLDKTLKIKKSWIPGVYYTK